MSENDQKVILKEEDIKKLEKPIDTVTDISDKKNDKFVEVLHIEENTKIVADNNNAKTEVIDGNAKGIRTTQEDSQVIVSEPTQSQSQDRFETIEKKEEEVKKCKETTEIKPLIETKEDLSQLSNNSTKRDATLLSSSLHDKSDQKNILEKEQIETELKSIQEKQKLENKINITDSMKISGQNVAQSSSCKSDDNNQPTKSEQMTVESSQGSSFSQSDIRLEQTSVQQEPYEKEKSGLESCKAIEAQYVIIEAKPEQLVDDEPSKLDQWGKPLSLPTPPDSLDVRKSMSKPTSAKSNSTARGSKQSKKSSGCEGPVVYVELAYVPHHADQHYCNADYFKRIRAKYYVFSGIDPHREVFEALIEGKKVWDKQLITTVIPTHESESLGFWISNNRNLLNEFKIEVAPAADRCSINLQGYETKCSAYRVEF